MGGVIQGVTFDKLDVDQSSRREDVRRCSIIDHISFDCKQNTSMIMELVKLCIIRQETVVLYSPSI